PVVVQLVSMPVVDSRGAVIACRVALSDITAVKRSETMVGLLATASMTLAASLRNEDAVGNVVDLLVPKFADVCLLDGVEPDGSLRRIRGGQIEGERTPALPAPALLPSAPALLAPTPALYSRVLSTGKPLLIADARDPARRDLKLDAVVEHAGSLLCVPILSQGQVLGVLTLGMTISERRYQPADLVFAQDVGSRIAAAIQSARLYRDA